MKNLILCLFLFLIACSKKEFSPIDHSFETQLAHQKITLTFHKDGRFSGHMINDYFGQYEINGNKIKFILQGTTMKIAPISQLEAENNYFQNLKNIHFFIIDKENLILCTDDFNYTFHLLNSDEMNIH